MWICSLHSAQRKKILFEYCTTVRNNNLAVVGSQSTAALTEHNLCCLSSCFSAHECYVNFKELPISKCITRHCIPFLNTASHVFKRKNMLCVNHHFQRKDAFWFISLHFWPSYIIPKKLFWEVMASLEHWISAEVMTMHSTPCQNHSATWDVHQLARHVLYFLFLAFLAAVLFKSPQHSNLLFNFKQILFCRHHTITTVYLQSQVWHQQNGKMYRTHNIRGETRA